ncbi:MAG: glycine zipper 2TM domain-containing protein [Pseudomonadales bacterium]|nr:glycine zipper 2TM domain-containing protein [Pseudomonadales bacterium]
MAIRRFLSPLLLSQVVVFGCFSAVAAHDEAKVVNVNPVYETVRFSTPREECTQERVAVYDRDHYYNNGYRDNRRHSATPGIIGALIGGAIGNGVGHNKTNKRVGLAVGALLGGAIGNDIAKKDHHKYDNYHSEGARNEKRYTTQEVCTVYDDWQTEQRLSGYEVTYVYAGETYTTRTNTHPGDTIRVRVRVTPAY